MKKRPKTFSCQNRIFFLSFFLLLLFFSLCSLSLSQFSFPLLLRRRHVEAFHDRPQLRLGPPPLPRVGRRRQQEEPVLVRGRRDEPAAADVAAGPARGGLQDVSIVRQLALFVDVGLERVPFLERSAEELRGKARDDLLGRADLLKFYYYFDFWKKRVSFMFFSRSLQRIRENNSEK